MKGIQQVLKVSVEKEHVATYTCQACNNVVTVQRMPIIGGPNKGKIEEIHIGCKCEDKALALAAQKAQIQSRIRFFLNEKSLINDDLKNASFETFDFDLASSSQLRAAQECKDYINSFDIDKPKNLLLYGGTGVGKSYIALSTLRFLIERKKYNGIFITVPMLLRTIKSTYNKNENSGVSINDIMDTIRDIDLLVLDDLGAEANTAHDITTIFEILDSRLGKHNIFTTNLHYDKFIEIFGERNASRLLRNTKILKITNKEDIRRHGVNIEEWQ